MLKIQPALKFLPGGHADGVRGGCQSDKQQDCCPFPNESELAG